MIEGDDGGTYCDFIKQHNNFINIYKSNKDYYDKQISETINLLVYICMIQ